MKYSGEHETHSKHLKRCFITQNIVVSEDTSSAMEKHQLSCFIPNTIGPKLFQNSEAAWACLFICDGYLVLKQTMLLKVSVTASE